MKFVVLEGLDGSGKSTQIKLLRKYLDDRDIKHQYLHFPRMDAPVYGELIARFLRGELGANNTVDPYLVALLYAGDRNEAAGMIKDWLKEGYFVLVDRYVISNIAFQCAKLKGDEQQKLNDWIIQLEYSHFGIPRPDLNIFLDVPFEFTRSQLSAGRTGDDRSYLKGNIDIHEDDLEFQKRVREVYLNLGAKQKNFALIECSSGDGTVLNPKAIFDKIIARIFN
ncbi:MAG: dTMP kinase [Bacteroidales bacterium]|nr:dTMP kinase [Bacteroidales bacterium]MCB9000020.1 dTMP kinase [Bacteroidales bacterium]MCB9013250.1 dTMP kinase [Bacteroidales bacterium]